jgi:hypothetical protein
MDAALTAALTALLGAPRALDALEVLHKLAANIRASADPKFRTLRLSNATLIERLFSQPGGMAALKALGFEAAAEGALVLPEGAALPAAALAQIAAALARVPPAAPAPAPAFGLSVEERAKRAAEAAQKAAASAADKAKLVAEASENQRQREAQVALMGGVKASTATKLGESTIKKFEPSGDTPGG